MNKNKTKEDKKENSKAKESKKEDDKQSTSSKRSLMSSSSKLKFNVARDSIKASDSGKETISE